MVQQNKNKNNLKVSGNKELNEVTSRNVPWFFLKIEQLVLKNEQGTSNEFPKQETFQSNRLSKLKSGFSSIIYKLVYS